MNTPIVDRQQLIEAMNALPDEALVEVAELINYLHHKSKSDSQSSKEILSRIAGLPIEGKKDAFSGRDHDRILYESQTES